MMSTDENTPDGNHKTIGWGDINDTFDRYALHLSLSPTLPLTAQCENKSS